MLTESDVRMIVTKVLDAHHKKSEANEDTGRRMSQSLNEPISLQIKSGRKTFGAQLSKSANNNNNRHSLANSTDSDQKKESSFELMEQMNKFLKSSQENNAEIMREMKTMNQNMSA